jgi:hypothetical protein
MARAACARRCASPAGSRWMKKKTTDTEDAIICRDRRALRDAEELLNQLRRTWDHETDGWRVRMAKDFPDLFHQWATNLPENVILADR